MCETKVAHNIPSYSYNFFLFWRNLKNERARASELFFIINQSISQNQGFDPYLPHFWDFAKIEKINNCNLEHIEQLLFHTFYPQMIFIFQLTVENTGLSGKTTVKSTKIPSPMQFFHWNHRSRYTYSVLNLFWHLGMRFLGISKNVRGCVILVHTE